MKTASLLLLLLTSTTLYSQNPGPAPCSSPEYHQFDFWIGDWEVWGQADTVVGYNQVEQILGTCVIMENWTGKGGSTGKSFNLYNQRTGEWEQTWVDNAGSKIDFHGKYSDGVLDMTSEGTGRDGKPYIFRLRFWNNDDGSVRQLWESTRDDGETWNVLFDGLYKQKKQKKPKK
jgi:hypothetical protein